jgi:hypothetical protein
MKFSNLPNLEPLRVYRLSSEERCSFSETLRIDNVHIPYHSGPRYGTDFVYVCLPGFMSSAFAEAGKTRRPTVVNEPSLAPETNRWWKIINGVDRKIGAIDKDSSRFSPKSLSTILESTGKGLTVNIVARFMAKASTEDRQSLRPSTPQRITLEIDRAFIAAVDVDVQMPTRIPKTKEKPEP